ncbi:ECF transporter S component [Enterococcus sp. JM4C]|uniref:ECF transporter S component n=1 Tax=Candidatus Enterococcus huntleyi TaxID=1857217 RepID=UPI0013796792|nr:ECF transporter S component [Enterococcus sp. JM4C]KAF1296747.1 ECF transporter S component [Enterococcus sp. JM4C]
MKTRDLTKIALMVAMTVSLSLLFIIPVPQTKGFVTLCEVGIYTSALLFGPTGGLFVGALSGGLIDLLSGYPEWALFSVLIHGIQGLLLGFIYQKFPNKQGLMVGFILASVWMIIGYALATSLLYTWPAGLASLPGNLIQNLFGIFVTVPLYQGLKRILHLPQYK